jgi:cyclin-dependent kinase 7
MNKKLVLDEGEIKYIALEIAKALGFLHGKWIMHRDVAPTNILLDLEANLKLTDFGLARYQAAPDKPMSINVITKYYRPPELFYGLKTYASSVDVWSFGCILAELYLRKPLFMGATEIEMLGKIFEVRGTPNYKTPTEQFNDWPGVQDLPWYLEINKSKPTPLEDVLFDSITLSLSLRSFRVLQNKPLT